MIVLLLRVDYTVTHMYYQISTSLFRKATFLTVTSKLQTDFRDAKFSKIRNNVKSDCVR